MKNKNGMGAVATTLIIVLAIVLVFGVIYAIAQTGKGGEPGIEGCADSTGVLTIQDYSALSTGTDPGTPVYTAGIKGEGDTKETTIVATTVTSGTTTFPIGAEVVVIAVLSDYLDEVYEFKMPCGGKTLKAPMYYSTSDNPSIKIKNDDDNFMTNSQIGGTTNQTDLTAGETLMLEAVFQGTNGESSGEGVWVLEFAASTSANISSVTFDGKQTIAIPSVHTLLNTSSEAVAFEVPAVVGSTKASHTLSIQLEPTKDLGDGVYTDWYAKQWFIDDDNTVSYGIQDSDGTAKYENTLDYDWFIDDA